jgi:hypothetical protein
MRIGQHLHVVKECSLGFAEVGSHFVESGSAIGDDGS